MRICYTATNGNVPNFILFILFLVLSKQILPNSTSQRKVKISQIPKAELHIVYYQIDHSEFFFFLRPLTCCSLMNIEPLDRPSFGVVSLDQSRGAIEG